MIAPQAWLSILVASLAVASCTHSTERERDAALPDASDRNGVPTAVADVAGHGSNAMVAGDAANAGSGGGSGTDAADGGKSGADAAVSGRGESGRASSTGGIGGAGQAGAGSSALRPYKGVANSPCTARGLLSVSWYYNWTETESEPCSDGSGGDFVPMIWGKPGNEQSNAGITRSVNGFVKLGYGYVLGFNEPDNSSQSNINVDDAIALWPAFDVPAIQIGSPGTQANANPGQTWFKAFMTQLAADPSLRTDFLALHWYGWNAGSCDAKASQLESYLKWAEAFPGNRPIWITEWGCLNQSAPDGATVVKFVQGALAMFARHPRVERYAWYPWATNCDLNAKDGSLTDLGKVYAAAPAYH